MVEMHWLWLLPIIYLSMGVGSLLTFASKPERGWDGMFDLILLVLWPLLLFWTIMGRRAEEQAHKRKMQNMLEAEVEILRALPDRTGIPVWLDAILTLINVFAHYGVRYPELQTACNQNSKSLKDDYPKVYSTLKRTCVSCFMR